MQRVILIAVGCLLWAATARADIELTKDKFERDDDPIVAKVNADNVPAGALMRGSLTISGKATVRERSGLYRKQTGQDGAATYDPVPAEWSIWAAPGEHTITANGIWVLTDTGALGGKLLDFGVYTYTKTFTVVGGDGPDPPPVPPPGNRWAIIWRETEQQTSAQKNLYLQLRQKYPEAKLQILDVSSIPDRYRELARQLPGSLALPTLQVIARSPAGEDSVVRAVACPLSVAAVETEIAR